MSATRVPTSARVVLAVASLVVVALAGCGGDDAAPATTPAPTTVPVTTVPTTTVPTTTQQVAIWPAADVVFASPQEAAADFVLSALGPGPVLGEFMAGDARSGEIEVFAADEDGQPLSTARSLLLLRQLGPDSGWFVTAAISSSVSIDAPEARSTVPAGSVTIAGSGTGFEAHLGIRAFLAGDATVVFDETVTMAGNFGEVLPYSVDVDLSAAAPGDVVVVLVHGGAGLETDPGDLSAIPIVISD